jgi:hypothetical protein
MLLPQPDAAPIHVLCLDGDGITYWTFRPAP